MVSVIYIRLKILSKKLLVEYLTEWYTVGILKVMNEVLKLISVHLIS